MLLFTSPRFSVRFLFDSAGYINFGPGYVTTFGKNLIQMPLSIYTIDRVDLALRCYVYE